LQKTESCVKIEGTAVVCFEFFDKLLNADGVRFMCCCVNFGAHPVMLLFVQIFPNLDVCTCILSCLLEKCLVLFVVALLHHRPEVLFTLFPLHQRNLTVKILGANPRILDSLSCNLSPLLTHLLFHETASSAGLCVHLCILSS